MRSHMFYRPSILRRVLIALGITLAALFVVVLSVFAARWYFSREKQVPVTDQPTVTSLNFELDPGITYQNITSDNALFFYSTENMKVINAAGELTTEVSLKMSQPAAVTKGSYTLFFDLTGKNLMTFNGTKQVTSLSLDKNILLATVNKSGYIVLVTEGDLHKCAVQVFTPEGEEIFKWNSGNLSVVGADIANNNKDITVSAINTDEGTIKSYIMMFNIAKEKPFTNDMYEDALYPVVRYSGGYLYCIGSNETLIYNGYGKCIGKAAYPERQLLEYVLDEDLLILAFSGSSDNSGAVNELKSFNHKGEETGSFSCPQEFDFLDAKGGTVVVNNGRTISVLNSHCQEKRQINLGFDLRDFVFLGSQNKGIGITASGAEMIELR